MNEIMQKLKDMAQEKVGAFLSTFKEYPPRQKAASFTVDQVLQQLQSAHGG